ncbi:MAG TPA: preprotein translocase subunit YajC [Thermodesulfobacteriota bacterium]|nr:preprotein translocase subunit YajC [Thermodesulfobacteriota bacterium]
MLDALAYAMGGAPGEGQAPGGAAGAFGFLLPFLLIVLIFYFIVFRPQIQRQKKHQAMLAGLKRGDQVYTVGGMWGKITGLTDKVVTLEVADNVRVKVYRNFIAGVVEPGSEAKPEGGA